MKYAYNTYLLLPVEVARAATLPSYRAEQRGALVVVLSLLVVVVVVAVAVVAVGGVVGVVGVVVVVISISISIN